MSVSEQLASALAKREAELRAVLTAAAHSGDKSSDVLDFKDVAAEDTQAAVSEAAATSAAEELTQVLAAMRRMEDGSYGFCLACGEPIDERRLLAMPATAYCTACQAQQEQHPSAGRR